MLLKDVEPGTRIDLSVKVVELMVSAETDHCKVSEFLVADHTACALCIVTGGRLTCRGRTVMVLELFFNLFF
jgi:hypothetical protein